MISRQVFGLPGIAYKLPLPNQVISGADNVRLWLPLRDSSGVTPDSLFILFDPGSVKEETAYALYIVLPVLSQH